MRSSADSLKKSADALNTSSLWEKKKIKKKDEETGEETGVEDYRVLLCMEICEELKYNFDVGKTRKSRFYALSNTFDMN